MYYRRIGRRVYQPDGRRKKGLLLAAALFLISAVGSAIPDNMNFLGAETISSFIFYRVIGGIGVGLASMLSPMYIAEIAPAGIRGKLVSWNQFAIIFGMLVVYFVNYCIARGQDQLDRSDGMAVDVRVGNHTGNLVFTPPVLCAGNPEVPGHEKQGRPGHDLLNRLTGGLKRRKPSVKSTGL